MSLINKEDLVERIENYIVNCPIYSEKIKSFIKEILEAEIKRFPTIDTQKRGKWIESNENDFENVYCSSCGCSTYRDECFCDYVRFAYCPHCGAKMECDE